MQPASRLRLLRVAVTRGVHGRAPRSGRGSHVGVTCSVLAGATQHGLRDAYRDLHGHETTPVTHLTTRAGKRCIDHTFVSRHFDVLSCEYLHELRERKLSDHSAMSTSLRFRREHPPLETWEVSAADHDEHGDTDEA